MGSEYKIEVKNLTKYFGDLHVINSISFSVKKGEFICIVGPTGCGKTTLLNLLTRLILPTSGEMYIDGVPANPKVHNISFAFQEPSAIPWLTVEENIKFGMKIKNMQADVIKERTEEILNMLGLEKFRNQFPHQLSVSSEQRIVIGRSFALYPDLLLMDEPYGQMDIKMRYYLEDEVIRLWKKYGSTVLFITHNIEEAVYLADRIIILTNKPATIKEELVINIPRPRDFASNEFIRLRKHVTDQIKWW